MREESLQLSQIVNVYQKASAVLKLSQRERYYDKKTQGDVVSKDERYHDCFVRKILREELK
jgi:hypothetical protein